MLSNSMLSKIGAKLNAYFNHYAAVKARQVLLTLDNFTLEQAGISPDLLLQGAEKWPWRAESVNVEQTGTSPAGCELARARSSRALIEANILEHAVKDFALEDQDQSSTKQQEKSYEVKNPDSGQSVYVDVSAVAEELTSEYLIDNKSKNRDTDKAA